MIINRQSCVVIDLTPMSKINVSLKICGFFVEKNRCDKLLSREYCVCVKTGMVKTVDFREKKTDAKKKKIKKNYIINV